MAFAVFVSYRRSTAAGTSGRLFDALAARFGDDRIFMDVDGIQPGADFTEVLGGALASCQAVVVVVDPGWLDVADSAGRRRLDDPDDFVRFEVERALSRNVPVIPVLVDGARMPTRAQLPSSMAGFTSRQAVEVTASRFKYDVGVLIAALEPHVSEPESRPGATLLRSTRRRRLQIGGLALLLITALVGGGIVAARFLPASAPSSLAWTALPDMPVQLEGAAVAAFDGLIWVVGGVSGEESRALLNTVTTFDPATSTWTTREPLADPVAFASLVALPDGLLLIGGQRASGATTSVQRWNPSAGSWDAAPPLPKPLMAGAGAWDGSRVVFGGGVTASHDATDAVYALGTAGWKDIGRLQIAREKAAAVSDGFGTVWIIGGRDRTSGTAAYGTVDVVQIDRISGGPAVTPVHSSSAAWFPGAGVCMIGGDTGHGVTNAVSCLNATNPPPDLPWPRAGLGAAALNGTIYAVGGYGDGNHGSATGASLSAVR